MATRRLPEYGRRRRIAAREAATVRITCDEGVDVQPHQTQTRTQSYPKELSDRHAALSCDPPALPRAPKGPLQPTLPWQRATGSIFTVRPLTSSMVFTMVLPQVKPEQMVELSKEVLDCLEYANIGVHGKGRHAVFHVIN